MILLIWSRSRSSQDRAKGQVAIPSLRGVIDGQFQSCLSSPVSLSVFQIGEVVRVIIASQSYGGMMGCAKRGMRPWYCFVHGFQIVVRMRTTMYGFGNLYVKYVTMVQRPPSLGSTMKETKTIIPS